MIENKTAYLIYFGELTVTKIDWQYSIHRKRKKSTCNLNDPT